LPAGKIYGIIPPGANSLLFTLVLPIAKNGWLLFPAQNKSE
jgi:hypothetical protein